MTDTATGYGKRRADFPDAGPTVEAMRPADPWDVATPTDTAPPRALAGAFAHTDDRLDRAEHMAGSLQATIQRLARQLEPLLTDGTYGRVDATLPTDGHPSPEDRRSTIAKRVSGIGDRADQLADFLGRLERELEDLSDALEIG